jgi:hypothetical protein
MSVLSRLSDPRFFLAYVVLCLLVGIFARKRRIGVWGFFFLSLILTPIVTTFFLVVASPSKTATRRPVKGRS